MVLPFAKKGKVKSQCRPWSLRRMGGATAYLRLPFGTSIVPNFEISQFCRFSPQHIDRRKVLLT